MKKIAINGFGRIGRLFLRQILKNNNVMVAAINDLGSADNLAYLLRYDSVYRGFEKEVSVKDGNLVVGGRSIKFLQIKEADKLPWKEMKIDVVIEATGVFESYEKAKVHLDAGAKRVVITAPAKDTDGEFGQTVLMGINERDAERVIVTSNGSCTTNASSPVIQIMHETVGIEKAILNTVHGYTATQNIVDGPVKGSDMRRGRAAAENIVPSTTGAALAVTRAIRDLTGRFDGIAMRVPVPAGSLADITFIAKRNTTPEEVNNIFRRAADLPRWKGILKVTDEPVVSSDILGEPYGAIVDTEFTKVVDGNLVKVLSWYDNEWGYVSTLVRHVETVAEMI